MDRVLSKVKLVKGSRVLFLFFFVPCEASSFVFIEAGGKLTYGFSSLTWRPRRGGQLFSSAIGRSSVTSRVRNSIAGCVCVCFLLFDSSSRSACQRPRGRPLANHVPFNFLSSIEIQWMPSSPSSFFFLHNRRCEAGARLSYCNGRYYVNDRDSFSEESTQFQAAVESFVSTRLALEKWNRQKWMNISTK